MTAIHECDGRLYGDNVPTVYLPMDTIHAFFVSKLWGVVVISRSSGECYSVTILSLVLL